MLQYALRTDMSGNKENNLIAQVTNTRSYSFDEIIDLMVQHGDTLSKTDVTDILQIYGEVVSSLLRDGCTINTPLFNGSVSINGVFKGASDSFDAARHTVNVQMNAGTLLRERMYGINTEKIEDAQTNPVISEITDVLSGVKNTSIAKGGILLIRGNRLNFDAADKEQGVFLISETGTAIRCSIVAENKPKRIMVMASADMDEAFYYVEVRSRLSCSDRDYKIIKTGRFDKALAVTDDNDSETGVPGA